MENTVVYVMKRGLLLKIGCWLRGRISFLEMSKLESIDIDLPEDFELAE